MINLGKTINGYRLVYIAGKIAGAVNSGSEIRTDRSLENYRKFLSALHLNSDEVGFANLYTQLQPEIWSALPNGESSVISINFGNVEKFRHSLLEYVGIKNIADVCCGLKIFTIRSGATEVEISVG